MKADQKARGLYLSGDVAFGFERGDDGELVPIEAQQEVIKEIAALRAQGRSLRRDTRCARRVSQHLTQGVSRPAGPQCLIDTPSSRWLVAGRNASVRRQAPVSLMVVLFRDSKEPGAFTRRGARGGSSREAAQLRMSGVRRQLPLGSKR